MYIRDYNFTNVSKSENNFYSNVAATNNTTVFEYRLNDDQRIALVLHFIYGLIAVSGNTILVLAMYRGNLLQYGGFLTLFHNAWTDIAVGCLNLFYVPWIILKYGALPPQPDQGYVVGLILVYGLFARKMFMVFMALTKFWSIMFPLSARSVMTLEWYKKALFAVWLISCLFCLAPWIKQCAYYDTTKLMWSVGPKEHYFYFVYWATVNSVVTTIFLATYPVCFCKLIKNDRYWKNRAVTDINGKNNSLTTCMPHLMMVHFREKNLLYIFSLDAIIYMLFTIPVYLFELLHVHIAHYGMYKETLRGILTSYTPIMYSLLNKNIRNAIFSLLLSPFSLQKLRWSQQPNYSL